MLNKYLKINLTKQPNSNASSLIGFLLENENNKLMTVIHFTRRKESFILNYERRFTWKLGLNLFLLNELLSWGHRIARVRFFYDATRSQTRKYFFTSLFNNFIRHIIYVIVVELFCCRYFSHQDMPILSSIKAIIYSRCGLEYQVGTVPYLLRQ